MTERTLARPPALENPVIDRANSPDLTVLSLFRICLSLAGIGYLTTFWQSINLSMASHIVALPYLEGACLFSIGMLFLQLIGWGGRTITILHFLAVTTFLPDMFPSISVNEELYLIAAFWACFMPLDQRFAVERSKKQSAKRWPIYMLAVNIGVFLFSAGMFKLADPRWVDGSFVAKFLGSPEMCPELFGVLSKAGLLTRLLDYSVIACDLLWLPLFLVPRFRPFSVIALFLFFAGLIFPARLDWIGQVGCCIPIALASVSPEIASVTNLVLSKFGLRGQSPQSRDTAPAANLKPPACRQRLFSYTAPVCLGILIVANGVYSIVLSPWRIGRPNAADSYRANVLAPIASKLPIWLQLISGHTICLGPKAMFTMSQKEIIRQPFLFRIEVKTDDGRVVVPLASLKTTGQLFAPPRSLTIELKLPVSNFMDAIRTGQKPTVEQIRDIDRILEYAASKVGPSAQSVRLLGVPQANSVSQQRLVWQEYCTWTPNQGVRITQ